MLLQMEQQLSPWWPTFLLACNGRRKVGGMMRVSHSFWRMRLKSVVIDRLE